MSTFLLTVGRASATARVRAALQPNGPDPETDRTVHQSLGADREVFCVTRRAVGAPAEPVPTDHLFLGTAFDHRARALVLGSAGFDDYRAAHDPSKPDDELDLDGVFLHAHWSSRSLVVERDPFGLYPVLWTASPDLVMISDSLLLLARLRRALGFATTADVDVVASRSVQNILAYQLASERTPVADIFSLPVGATLQVGSGSDDRPAPSVDRACVADLFVPDSDSYTTLLRQGAHEVSAVVQSIVGIPGPPATLSLSGGLDSRILLAVLVRDPALLAETRVTTSTIARRADDRSVTESLGARYGFAVNPPSDHPVVQRASTGPVGQWALGSLGVYDYLYLRRSLPEPGVVALGGQGSEIMKGSLGWTSIAKLRIEGRRKPVQTLRRIAREGLESIGIEPDHPLGVEWHNVGYRNPIHTGQLVPRAQPLHFRPLMQRSLALAARAPDNPQPRPRPKGSSVITDLLALLGPELCSLPFAEGRSPLDSSVVAARLDALGGPLAGSGGAYRVHGATTDVAVGAPDCFLAMVSDLEDLGASPPDVIASTGERARDLVPRRFRKDHADSIAVIDAYQPGEDQLRAGMATAKILTLELLR